VGRQDRDCRTSNLVGLGGTLNQGDSRKGNSDYYPCESGREGVSGRKGDITRIRIPSGMRQGFGDEREKKENGHVSFTERDG
jgi:hypothetical protein